MDIEYQGAFVTVDDIKYEEYTCKQCHTVVQGKMIEDESERM